MKGGEHPEAETQDADTPGAEVILDLSITTTKCSSVCADETYADMRIVFTILLDKLFGEPVKRIIWKYICEGGVLLLAVQLYNLASAPPHQQYTVSISLISVR